MADQDYHTKLDSLKKYIPFLENMMAELKTKGNREAQLNKIKSLHDMITDTRKKLKLETLNRCEEVLNNIYFKVNPQLKSKINSNSPRNLPGIEIPKRNKVMSPPPPPIITRIESPKNLPGIESPRSTPASPSPPRDIFPTKPITIPTEKIEKSSSGYGSDSFSRLKSQIAKIDVYSNVLINNPNKMPKHILPGRVPDTSKPPISLDDLKGLEDDVQQKITDATLSGYSVDDLQEYRKQLEFQIRVEKVIESMSPTKAGNSKPPANVISRNPSNPLAKTLDFTDNKPKVQETSKTSKNPSSPIKEIKSPTFEKKKTEPVKASKESTTKCVKESDSMFGSLLSSIDSKLLEDKKKSKKSDRRPSKEEAVNTVIDITGSDINNSKSDNKETEAKSSDKEKDKTRSESDKHRSSSLNKERKDRKKEEKDKLKSDKSKSEKSKDRKSDSKSKEHKKKDKKDKDRKSSKHESKPLKEDEIISSQKTNDKNKEPLSSTLEKLAGKPSSATSRPSELKIPDNSDCSIVENSNTPKLAETHKSLTVYKRLADKYNPKPRQKPGDLVTADVDKAVSDSIERNMKTSPATCLVSPLNDPKIPLLGERGVSNAAPTQFSGVSLQKDKQQVPPSKPVQLPDIIQKIFSKPLLGDIIPKGINEPIVSSSSNIQNRSQVNIAPLPPPPEPPLLSPPLQSALPMPGMKMSLLGNSTNLMSPPQRPGLLPTPAVPPTLAIQPRNPPVPVPKSIQSGFGYQNQSFNINATQNSSVSSSRTSFEAPSPLPDFGSPDMECDFRGPRTPRVDFEESRSLRQEFEGPIGPRTPRVDFDGPRTPRVDFDGPRTPRIDFEPPRMNYEPPVHYSNNQLNVNQRVLPHMQNFESLNQNIMCQPQVYTEVNVYNQYDLSLGGVNYFPVTNQMPMVTPEVPVFMPEQQFYQERQWNEGPRWGRDIRPGDPRSYREYKEMKERQEREARATQERQIEIKDPRLAARDSKDGSGDKDMHIRDPRIIRDKNERGDNLGRDPRLIREKSVDPDRARDKGLDPNNRSEVTFKERSKSRSRDFRNKDPRQRVRSHDAKDEVRESRPIERQSRFDKMYANTNKERSQSKVSSKNVASDNEDESFTSPLDSLYNAGEKDKTGRGYGVQKFKIPKKNKRAEVRSSSPYPRRRPIPLESDDESDDNVSNVVEEIVINSEGDSDVEQTKKVNEHKKTKEIDVRTKQVKDKKKPEIKNKSVKVKLGSKDKDSKSKINVRSASKKINPNPTVDTERIKVIIGSESNLNKWTESKDTNDLEEFVSEYDKEFNSEKKDKITEPLTISESVEDMGINSNMEESVGTVENKEQNDLPTNMYDIQIEEPSSTDDVIESSKDIPEMTPEATVSAESVSVRSVETVDKMESVKQAESIEPDSSRKSDGSLTPQGNSINSNEPSEQNILAHFFENLLKSKNKKDKKTALFSLIETFSDSFDDREIQKIRKIININDQVEDESENEDEESKVVEPKEAIPDQSAVKDHIVPAEPAPDVMSLEEELPVVGSTTEELPRTRSKRITRLSSFIKVQQDIAEPSQVEEEEEKIDTVQTKEIENPEDPQTTEVSKFSETEVQESEIANQSLEPIYVSVGERIKNRKRVPTPPKPRKKVKTELDRLHGDIQEMFIRDGVLTATGKRMCRILKDDPNALSVSNLETNATPSPSTDQTKKISRKKPGPKPKTKVNKVDITTSVKDVRVLIKKMPDTLPSSTTRTLRSRTRKFSFVESESESQEAENDNSSAESDDYDKSVTEDESSDESDGEESKSQTSESAPKQKKKRRVSRWASGIIPRSKKKKPQNTSKESSPDRGLNILDLDFDKLEPDKNYYVDYVQKTKIPCKLCEYSGHVLTGHYLREHPDSEVLCSRLPPDVAKNAMEDFKSHGTKYESVVLKKASAKYEYSCRLCGFTSHTTPVFFYEHVTTHTGEYRHQCGYCEFFAATGKTLAAHFLTVHPGQERKAIRTTYTLAVVFGYLCGECNYLQLKQKNVEEHANIYHLGDKPNIYKINMSLILDPACEIPETPEISSVKELTDVVPASEPSNKDTPVKPSKKTKTRKKPAAVSKVGPEEPATEDENKEKEDLLPVIRKKPGPKSKTMPSIVIPNKESKRNEAKEGIDNKDDQESAKKTDIRKGKDDEKSDKVPEISTLPTKRRKPGPKSKTQKLEPSEKNLEESTDDEVSKKHPKRKTLSRAVHNKTLDVVASSSAPLETITKKRSRSLENLLNEDSGDDLDTIITLSSRSSRAAKEKATAKLKTLMESHEGTSIRKKPDTEVVRKDKEHDVERNNKENKEAEKDEEAPKSNEGHDALNKDKEHGSLNRGKEDDTLNKDKDHDALNKGQVAKDKVQGEENPAEKRKNIENRELKTVCKKKVKNTEMNVFTCKTDIMQEDAKKIEEERLRKMEELNKSIGSRQSKLDFVDKLCNRLNSEQTAEVPNITIKEEPKESSVQDSVDKRPPTPTMPILEKQAPAISLDQSLPITKMSISPVKKVSNSPIVTKKPLLEDSPIPQSKINFGQKVSNLMFSDMIKKLQGKVNEAAEQENSPNISKNIVEESTPSANEQVPEHEPYICMAGFLKATRRNKEIFYSCHAGNCYVTTKDKMVFQLHCKFGHRNLAATSALCDICGVHVETTCDTNLLENLFDHMMFAHSDFIDPKPVMLRMRRLSGDKLSIKKEIESNKEPPVENEPEQLNITAPPEPEPMEVVPSTETTEESVSAAHTSPSPQTETPASVATLELAEDFSFDFKIEKVMSLAETNISASQLDKSSSETSLNSPPSSKIKELTPCAKPVPPLTLIGTTKKPALIEQSQGPLILKEAKLTAFELSRSRKAAKALKKFIATPSDLYKCPHHYCMFTSNVRTFLERHLKAHKADNNFLIPCVYCDMKTPLDHVPMHIDIRHAHCRYACKYCLYRAWLREYVCLHQKEAHPGEDFAVVVLPPHRAAKKFSVADNNIDYKNLCEPFRCVCQEGQPEVLYLFENEFRNHLTNVHKNNFVSCGFVGCTHRVHASMMPNHWSVFHGIGTYQCGYCKTSAKEVSKMYNHFAQAHPSMQPDILVRIYDNLLAVGEFGYSQEAFDKLGHIKKMPNNLLQSLNQNGSKKIKLLHLGNSGEITKTTTEDHSNSSTSLLKKQMKVYAGPVKKISTPEPQFQFIVATTSSGGDQQLVLIPSSSLGGVIASTSASQSVTSVAPINKSISSTSSVSKELLSGGSASLKIVSAANMSTVTKASLPKTTFKVGNVTVRPPLTPTRTVVSSAPIAVTVSSAATTTKAASESVTSQSEVGKVTNDYSSKFLRFLSEGRSLQSVSDDSQCQETESPINTPTDAGSSLPSNSTNILSESENMTDMHSQSPPITEADMLESAIESILSEPDVPIDATIIAKYNLPNSSQAASQDSAPSTEDTGNLQVDIRDTPEYTAITKDILQTALSVTGITEDDDDISDPIYIPDSESESSDQSRMISEPPPLVRIGKSSSKSQTTPTDTVVSSMTDIERSQTPLGAEIIQSQNENTPDRTVPVEVVDVAGSVSQSPSLVSDDVDPLNLDSMDHGEDSNSEAPLFADINVGLDSPPEDPLSITPTLNANLTSSDDPLGVDVSAAQDPLVEDKSHSKEVDPAASLSSTEKSPLKITDMRRSSSMVSNSDDESDSSSSDKGKKRGLMGYQLFRCAICNLSFSNLNTFKSHVSNSLHCKKSGSKPFPCVHCDRGWKTAQRLADHIQTHGVQRFACSLCNEKFTTVGIVKLHIKNRHNIHQTILVPLKSDRNNPETDDFVVKPQTAIPPLNRSFSSTDTPKLLSEENTFNPDQINIIPIRQIFSQNVKCGLCNYQTKVRVNIIRHLQMHLDEKAVSDTAPVNPVPCLEKNEKMFDKMINLAASSFTGSNRMGGPNKVEKEEEKYPEFVPTHCRFVCGAQGCSYLCPEEGNLKHHLMALHSDESDFMCAHCKEKITPNDAESVIKHFKLHGLQLYKCSYCKFVHNLKHRVEKHVADSHLDAVVKVVTVRYMESEPQDIRDSEDSSTPQPPTSKFKPWRCCMCKCKYFTKEDVQSHIVHRHDIDTQYKCTLCAFKNDQEYSFKQHFAEVHPGHEIDMIFVYQKVEEEPPKEDNPIPFDTTPLWQRDKPRVRHIRGILFDESSPQPTKSPKKAAKLSSSHSPKVPSTPTTSSPKVNSPLMKVGNTSSGSSPKVLSATVSQNVFDCIDAVARGTAETLLNMPSASSNSSSESLKSKSEHSEPQAGPSNAKPVLKPIKSSPQAKCSSETKTISTVDKTSPSKIKASPSESKTNPLRPKPGPASSKSQSLSTKSSPSVTKASPTSKTDTATLGYTVIPPRNKSISSGIKAGSFETATSVGPKSDTTSLSVDQSSSEVTNIVDDSEDDVQEIVQVPNIIVIDSDDDDVQPVQPTTVSDTPKTIPNEEVLKSSPGNDDTPTSKDKDNKLNPISKNRGLKRRQPSSGSDLLQEAVKMAKIELEDPDEDTVMATKCKREHLIALYGSVGTPLNKQWRCPKCHQFKSKRVSDLVFHIYKEFNVYRYKCTQCCELSITYKYMQEHLKAHVGAGEETIEALAPNLKLETWIHIVLREQTLVILENFKPFQKRPITGQTDICCIFCNEKFMSMPDCYEHMLYHWAMMPYQCPHCPSEFYTVFDLKHHHKIEHPDLKLYCEPKGPTLEKALRYYENTRQKRPYYVSKTHDEIKGLDLHAKKAKLEEKFTQITQYLGKREKGKEKMTEGNDNTDSSISNNFVNINDDNNDVIEVKDLNNEVIRIDSDDDDDAVALKTDKNVFNDNDLFIVTKTDDKVPNDDEVYACNAGCPYMTDTEEKILTHLEGDHCVRKKKYHVLSKKNAETDSELLGCGVCDIGLNELKLRLHFLEEHLGQQYAVYKLKCNICRRKFLSFNQLKIHFGKVHNGQNLQYSTADGRIFDSPKVNDKMYKCPLCTFTSISTNSIGARAHLKVHLKPNICKHCGWRFRHFKQGISHHLKEHPLLEEDFGTVPEAMADFSRFAKEMEESAVKVTYDSLRRNFARKSTSAPMRLQMPQMNAENTKGPEKCIDLSSIITTFELEGLEYTTTAEQMKKMLDIDPYVDVSDCIVDIVPVD